MKRGDRICFYAAKIGVVAHAWLASAAREPSPPAILDAHGHEWRFALDSVEMYLDNPVVVDKAPRARLDAFQGRDAGSNQA